jgi:hypothetical protein
LAQDEQPDKIGKLRKQYLDFAHQKQKEREEQKEARRYYHGCQLSDEQLKRLKSIRQAPVIKNEVSRKVNGVVGLLERLRQDPKAYARTPDHEDGADLATYAVRYVLDANNWKALSSDACHEGAVPGIGGCALTMENGDADDVDIGLEFVDADYFFYDARSVRPDFSDARFMGEAKWVSEDVAVELFPDKADEIGGMMSSDASDAALDMSDKDKVWVNSQERSLKIVEHWYVEKGQWKYCFYSGALELDSGDSPWFDHKKRSIPRYLMFSGSVDQDGDRYGLVRNLKYAQDEVNARGSSALQAATARRIKYKKGAFADPERARREAARHDGMIEWQGPDAPEFEDAKSQANMMAHLKFQELAKAYIDNYGFNPSLVGTGVSDMSGRAIALQQQAGIAELGPFIVAFKDWKLRVYRAILSGIQKHWKGERWIRVTDDEDVAQFIQINGVEVDPVTGQPQMVNAIGSLDVDIVMDEAPDTINMMADTHEALGSILQSIGAMLTPQQAQAAVGIYIDSSTLPAKAKKAWREASEPQQDPLQDQAKMVALEGEVAKVKETQSKTLKNTTEAMAKAKEMMMPQPTGFDERQMDREDREREVQNARQDKAQDIATERQNQSAQFERDRQNRDEQFVMDQIKDQQSREFEAQQAALAQQIRPA